MRPSLPLEQVAAQDQRQQVAGIDGQRALDRRFLSLLILEATAGQRQVDPLMWLAAIGIDHALKRDAG